MGVSALRMVEVATSRFREVKAVTAVGNNVRVTVDYRMNNKYLPVFLEQLDRALHATYNAALIVEPLSDEHFAVDPNFESTPGTGPIVPTTWDWMNKKGEKNGKR